MPKARLGRALTVNAPASVVRERLDSYASLYEFRLDSAAEEFVQYTRGTILGSVVSFDIQKVPGTLMVELMPSGDPTSVKATLVVGSIFQIISSGDRQALEKQMDVLIATIRGE